MFDLHTVGKKLNPVDRIVIRFRYGQKWIRNLRILLVSSIIIDIFFFNDLFNIRRIRQIVQKACIYCGLAVDTLFGLLHN